MARRRYNRRKKSNKGILFLFILILIGIATFYIYTSPRFEKTPPKILLDKNIYANDKKPLEIKISDNIAIKNTKVIISNGVSQIILFNQSFLLPQKNQIIKVDIPKEISKKGGRWKIIIEAVDNSLWNFFMGNKSIAISNLFIDNLSPKVSIISKSPSLTKGGTALVIAKIDDKSLDKVYIKINDKIKFFPINYIKNNIYASLFVWPFNIDKIEPQIIAIDKAGNKTIYPIRINMLHRKFKTSKIKVSDKFIDGKITQLIQTDKEFSNIKDKLEKFKAVNEYMRKKNEALIHKLSKYVTPIDQNWKINRFYPLHRAKKVANFGDHRFYYYNDPNNIISTSYHLGLDLASIKHDNIYSSNKGKIVFASFNGIYGNMPMIDHGFGLYTIYGHCSEILLNKGDIVKENEIIAKTGMTGLALGDHLHFGILVQGIEVYPQEWMNKNWIKSSINDVFNKAKEKIGYNNNK